MTSKSGRFKGSVSPPCPLSKRVFLTASDSHVENAPETTTTTMMMTMTTCERASVRLHFAEEGQCQEERGKRGDEEIMGVAVGRWCGGGHCMGERLRVLRQSFPIQGMVKTRKISRVAHEIWAWVLPFVIFDLNLLLGAGMNSLASLPRLTAEAAAAEIWPKLGSNIGTNIYLECGIPGSPLVVLIAAAARRNEWRRIEAETMQRWHSCLPSTTAPPPAPPHNQHPSTWDGCSLHRVTTVSAVAGHGQ